MNDKKNDLVLLYDKALPEHLVEELNQLKKPRKEGGFGWKKVLPWESFVGGECDTVVYVGSGSLEAFSRARLKLMIVTVPPRDPIISDYFFSYIKCLRSSVAKDLLKKKEARDCFVESPNVHLEVETNNELALNMESSIGQDMIDKVIIYIYIVYAYTILYSTFHLHMYIRFQLLYNCNIYVVYNKYLNQVK